jgi:hypothetical protein
MMMILVQILYILKRISELYTKYLKYEKIIVFKLVYYALSNTIDYNNIYYVI